MNLDVVLDEFGMKFAPSDDVSVLFESAVSKQNKTDHGNVGSGAVHLGKLVVRCVESLNIIIPVDVFVVRHLQVVLVDHLLEHALFVGSAVVEEPELVRSIHLLVRWINHVAEPLDPSIGVCQVDLPAEHSRITIDNVAAWNTCFRDEVVKLVEIARDHLFLALVHDFAAHLHSGMRNRYGVD